MPKAVNSLVARVMIQIEIINEILRYGRAYFPMTPSRETEIKRVKSAAMNKMKNNSIPGEK